jgi:hypothetical protein
MRGKINQSASNLPLHEIVALAAYLAGADRRHVDTEDIAHKANEIAPGRFSWRKYRDQIKLDAIYKHLWDLTKPEKGEYITGSDKDGWLLTLEGTSFAERTVGKLKELEPARERRPRKEEAWIQRERNRMLGEIAFLKIRNGKETELTSSDAERFFRLDDYVIGAARSRKIQQAENEFHDDPELGPVVAKIASFLRGKK